MNFKTGSMIATAAASLMFGFTGCGNDDVEMTQQGIKCEGGNSCSAMSECKATGKNECTAMNKCAGMGYITTQTQAECDAAKIAAAKAAAAMATT
jgi:hypothetical protein